jgi:hypothetical protein
MRLAAMEAMMRGSILGAVAGAALSIGFGAPVKAQDAEFGCKVLLCAAASNPSWPSIPYCVPIMNQLQTMMRSLRFRWPVCTAAGTGAPGFEPYQPCPAGWQEATRNDGAVSNGVSGSPTYGGNDLCARRLPIDAASRPMPATVPGGQVQCFSSSGDIVSADGPGQTCVEYRPRPQNERPYYFDLRNPDGVATRVWFSVR